MLLLFLLLLSLLFSAVDVVVSIVFAVVSECCLACLWLASPKSFYCRVFLFRMIQALFNVTFKPGKLSHLEGS